MSSKKITLWGSLSMQKIVCHMQVMQLETEDIASVWE